MDMLNAIKKSSVLVGYFSSLKKTIFFLCFIEFYDLFVVIVGVALEEKKYEANRSDFTQVLPISNIIWNYMKVYAMLYV